MHQKQIEYGEKEYNSRQASRTCTPAGNTQFPQGRVSRCIWAFDLFWNGWASKHDNIKLIVCGSATTWMTNKLLGDKGGLHNRVTKQIYLRPFNLSETEEFLKLQGFDLSRQHIVEIYMAFGGTPYYHSLRIGKGYLNKVLNLQNRKSLPYEVRRSNAKVFLELACEVLWIVEAKTFSSF